MAEAMLKAVARARQLDMTVSSAGILPGDRVISPLALEALGDEAGLVAEHRSRPLVAEELRHADLILGMAREHVREIVITEPTTWPKSFTLKELVRRGTAAGRRRDDETLGAWIERVGEDRSRQELLGFSEDDDVSDPVGAPLAVVEETADEIRALLDRVLELIAPS